MKFQSTKSVILALAAAALLLPTGALAQQTKPASKTAQDYASRWDIFAGYSYLAPHGTVNTPQPGSPGVVLPFDYKSVNLGGLVSGAYYFNRFGGVQLEQGIHPTSKTGFASGNDTFYTTQIGPIFRFPTNDVTPFVHALVGGAFIGGPDHQPMKLGPALTAGGGLDYETPLLNHHLAIRLFQADYEYMHADWGQKGFGGRANINAARLSAGLVLHVGAIVYPQVSMACSVSPSSVFPGEPVTITSTPTNLDPKKKTDYEWTGTGVKGTDNTGTVDTSALAPGSYTVKVMASQGKKPYQMGDCSSSFTVKQFEPPTISCSANPGTLKPGETSVITATGVSPQNRPLTYSYSATAGSIVGAGNTATYSSAGAPTGSTGITCTVSDDKGQTATSTTSVSVEAPYVPPAPKMSSLCSLSFDKDKKRPTRVDNEAKACLDDIALTLQKQSDAKAAMVGTSSDKEKDELAKDLKKKHSKAVDPAAERAVNAKDYLVTEKGIDASRVDVYTSTTDGQKVDNYLIPAGASFDVPSVSQVNADVKPQVRKPLGMKQPAKKSKKTM